jgi:hypothetical protein
MSDVEKRFHETWLGMVQPVEGLVVSVPVLVDAQCMEKLGPEAQVKLIELCPPTGTGDAGPEGFTLQSLPKLLEELLELTPDLFDAGEAIPEAMHHYVPEGRQVLKPTLGLRKQGAGAEPTPEEGAEVTAAGRAGAAYAMLVWDTEAAAAQAGAAGAGIGLDLDKPETVTGPWEYPPAAKFDRLLRHARVSIGLLTNRQVLRLVYAPHGESSGHITFRIEDMVTVGGRPILDALVMLLNANRCFGVRDDVALPALLADSRRRQANVTNELAEQVFDALGILLSGFEAAAERDGRNLLEDALARDHDHLYKGLLTVLLRLVFLLYAEDRGMLPVDERLYAEHLSVLGLFERLQADAGAYPDSMPRRFGAWAQLVSLFRSVFLGMAHGSLQMPARQGALFDPNTYPFLEGWGPAGAAPVVIPEHRAGVQVPTVSDEVVFRVLDKLVIFEGQRLSYRTLDVEQIGSVYEALMGYHVVRTQAPAVRMKPSGVWLSVEEAMAEPPARRAKWLKEEIGMVKAQAEKLAEDLQAAKTDETRREALLTYAKGRTKAARAHSTARAGQLVLQPGSERRRTSSHYTPRSLSAPIVRRTIEPLLACMGETPPSDQILELKICDPAMGSGAFLVEACRFLGDHLVAAWTREGKLEEIAKKSPGEDPTLHARRLVAQRCLYGVDKNDAAVELAKLSLWLVTLAKDLPFTFIDHALRHGDSLVGLNFDQIKAFHWKPGKQVHLAEQVLGEALEEAIAIRQKILELAEDGSAEGQREKRRLLSDAADACDRARLLGDVVVGAFFAKEKDKDREAERTRRFDLVQKWLGGDREAEAELRGLQQEIRARLPVFHWMLEYPEVFYAERPDPLEQARVNRAACMDAFVGNPPFAGKNGISDMGGPAYLPWLCEVHEGAHGNADLSAHFFRRAAIMLGSHGTCGLIATNTIAQGDTRATSLQFLTEGGASIYDATESMPWPGEAAVTVSVVHLAFGNVASGVQKRLLGGHEVPHINSQLKAGAERSDPETLTANAGAAFVGSYVLGMGFTLTPEARDALVASDKRNAERIFPYLGGQEVNTSLSQNFDRYVISFGTMSEDEAGRWPDLLGIVRREVKPERDKLRNNSDGIRRKTYWWQFGRWTPALYAAIAPLKRCLVCAIVSKHLMFSFQPTDRIFSHKLYVFPFERTTQFAILQSRIHAPWAWLLSSTMRNAGINYSASDCFETFPFPAPDPRTVHPALDSVGERLYAARASYMVDENVGLTITYNRLKDPANTEPRILELRHLHEEMDRTVIAAYAENDPEGKWDEVAVPPFCPMNAEDEAALKAFEAAVIDRLFALNAKRAKEEEALGLRGAKGKKGGGKDKRGKKKGAEVADGQASLDLEES